MHAGADVWSYIRGFFGDISLCCHGSFEVWRRSRAGTGEASEGWGSLGVVDGASIASREPELHAVLMVIEAVRTLW